MISFDMIIDGKAVRSAVSQDVINPATEEVFARVAKGDATHANMAVSAARTAFAKV